MAYDGEVLFEQPALSYGEFVAGGVGGAVGLVVGHPFDTTKVQLQTQQVARTSTWRAIVNIAVHGLSGGFFRGLSFPLAGTMAINAIMYGVYSNALPRIARLRSEPLDTPSHLSIFLAGSTAGAAQLVIACPMDMVKVVLQSQIVNNSTFADQSSFFKGPMQCARDAYRRSGLRGLYKGLTIMANRDVASIGLYYTVYNYLFTTLPQRWPQLGDSRVAVSLVAGGVAGVATWATIIPLDVIKSRFQADVSGRKYHNVRHCIRDSYQRHGLPVFMKGFTITCLRAFPVNAVIFCTYQQLMDHVFAKR